MVATFTKENPTELTDIIISAKKLLDRLGKKEVFSEVTWSYSQRWKIPTDNPESRTNIGYIGNSIISLTATVGKADS